MRGKLLKDKTASGFVEKGEARYIKQGGQGANVLQFTDPNAEAKFLRAREQSARNKKQYESRIRAEIANRTSRGDVIDFNPQNVQLDVPEDNWQLDIYFDGVHHICPIPAVDEADAKKQTSAIIDRCTDAEMLLWDNLEGEAYEDDEVIGYVQFSAPHNPTSQPKRKG